MTDQTFTTLLVESAHAFFHYGINILHFSDNYSKRLEKIMCIKSKFLSNEWKNSFYLELICSFNLSSHF